MYIGNTPVSGPKQWTIIIANVHNVHNVHTRVFSRDILKGGNIGVLAGGKGVLGVYYILENIIHYYYCQSEGGGKTAVKGGKIPPSPPLEKPCGHRYIRL